MQKLPAQFRKATLDQMKLSRGSVQRISGERMPNRGEVHTNLMRPACVELDFDQRGRPKFAELSPFRESFAHRAFRQSTAGLRLDCKCFHAGAADRVAADR